MRSPSQEMRHEPYRSPVREMIQFARTMMGTPSDNHRHMRRVVAAFLTLEAALTIGACNCGDKNNIRQLRGNLMTVDTVDFGDVQVGLLVTMPITVKNIGNVAVQV